MDSCMCFLVLLVASAATVDGTFTSVTYDYHHDDSTLHEEIVCEHGHKVLQCGHNEVIKITSAVYGRTDHVTCLKEPKYMSNTHCISHTPMHILETKCNGKNRCTVVSSNSIYGDPCHGTYKYLTVQYECEEFSSAHVEIEQGKEIICEHDTVELQCGYNEVIKITSAIYGRTDKVTCPKKPKYMCNTHCISHTPMHILEKKCNGRNKCTVVSSNSIYGDPCYGTYKYLTVKYDCEDGGGITYNDYFNKYHGFELHGDEFSYNDNDYKLSCPRSRFYRLWSQCYRSCGSKLLCFKRLLKQHLFGIYH